MDELPPDSPEVVEARIREHAQRLKAFMHRMEDKRDEYVRGKADIEKRMVDDLRQYEGLPRVVGSKDRPGRVSESVPRIHRTRSRTDMMEARLSDMLFSQPAWGVKPTPVPELSPEQMLDPQTGQPLTPAQVEAKATASAERMLKRISDILAESKFESIGRKMARDACRVGTGLLMGPMNVLRHKRKFNRQPGQPPVNVVSEPRPEIRYGDPWCFYPELAESAEKAQAAFYLHLMSRAELQEFALHPGVDTKAVARVLKQDPELGEVGKNLSYRNQHSPYREETKERYAVWRYTGIVDRGDAECLGLCSPQAQESDALEMMPMADLWFCQGEVFRAKLTPFEGDYRIPYFVFAPFPADDSMFGLSLPYLCRDTARCADAAFQAMLHNASVSSGPLIFAKREAFQPAKGDTMEVTGPRWFWMTDPDAKVSEAVEVVQFQNTAEQAMAIMNRVLELMDDELNMPQVVGDVSASKPLTQTSSGMAMLMNQMLTIMQRRGAAAYDDGVVIPMTERLYWWEMEFGDDEEAKGDFQVEAMGQSVLLVKDIRVQHLMMLLQLAQDDPEINVGEIKAEIARMLDIKDEKFRRSPDEVAEITKNQPPDPLTVRAQAELERALAAKAQVEADAAIKQKELELKMRDRELDHAEFQMTMQDRERERFVKLTVADGQLEIAAAKLVSDENLTAEGIAAKERIEQARSDIAQQRDGMKARIDAEKIVARERETALEVRVESPNPRLA